MHSFSSALRMVTVCLTSIYGLLTILKVLFTFFSNVKDCYFKFFSIQDNNQHFYGWQKSLNGQNCKSWNF